MKRIKATFASESAARTEGLKRARSQAEGFDCECGKHYNFSKYTIAHWNDVLQQRCIQCGRQYKLLKGVVTEISGPTLRKSRMPASAALNALADPSKPMWRTYQQLHSHTGVTYQPASDYAGTLDMANDLSWNYAINCEPHNKSRREDLYRALIRREEFPLLSTVEVSGLIVGGGHISECGTFVDPLRGQCRNIALRTPKGEIARITFTEEVWEELMRAFEMKSMSTTEALAAQEKEK